jgi:ABC-type molybdate transport system substrate-binding protein
MSDEVTGIYNSDYITGNPTKSRRFSRVFLAAACAVTTAIILAILLGVTFAKYQKVSTAPSQQEVSSYIIVHHAASLKSVMTKIINPAFTAKYNIGVTTVSNSSGILAKGLKAGAIADVFISADSKITDTLLLQKVNPIVSWYSYWVCSSVGLAYNTGSKYSSVFRSIAKGTVPWYKAINSTMKIGRTHPDHDPKGNYANPLVINFCEHC